MTMRYSIGAPPRCETLQKSQRAAPVTKKSPAGAAGLPVVMAVSGWPRLFAGLFGTGSDRESYHRPGAAYPKRRRSSAPKRTSVPTLVELNRHEPYWLVESQRLPAMGSRATFTDFIRWGWHQSGRCCGIHDRQIIAPDALQRFQHRLVGRSFFRSSCREKHTRPRLSPYADREGLPGLIKIAVRDVHGSSLFARTEWSRSPHRD